ncbi:MAG: glycosyl transferase, partial [Candidatus Binatia bacterium]
GPTGRRWAAALAARGYPIRRFVDSTPRRWGRELYGARIEAPHPPRRDDGFVLSAAGSLGARAGIEAWMRGAALRPFDDYLAVA